MDCSLFISFEIYLRNYEETGASWFGEMIYLGFFLKPVEKIRHFKCYLEVICYTSDKSFRHWRRCAKWTSKRIFAIISNEPKVKVLQSAKTLNISKYVYVYKISWINIWACKSSYPTKRSPIITLQSTISGVQSMKCNSQLACLSYILLVPEVQK